MPLRTTIKFLKLVKGTLKGLARQMVHKLKLYRSNLPSVAVSARQLFPWLLLYHSITTCNYYSKPSVTLHTFSHLSEEKS